ncbi:MAG TPA: zinc dependent phospholipase C family protein [Saprospiraceae bacterium]|nr:zinc dependent phospholipase C family protein [Saprospiraceae bacterium]
MKNRSFIPDITLIVAVGVLLSFSRPVMWGFYGHKLINRMAVFTLPPELIGFYKKHIEYITEHAVDPDKRRYATKHEGPRHFIDIDHWDKIPFDNVPRDFEEAIIQHCSVKLVFGQDSVYFNKEIKNDSIFLKTPYLGGIYLTIDYPTFVKYWKKVIKPLYYDDQWRLSGYDFDELFGTTYFQKNKVDILIEDHFSEYGIVPYQLEMSLSRLTYAFEQKDKSAILRLSTEFGHYIGDAHVPLHTTKNYNGQLSNQNGIHAFWESRIPELFAERNFDFFVGKAEYVENPKDYIWDIIIKAHSHLDSVLAIELRLSKTFDSDKQYCYDERLGRTVRLECPEYAEAYMNAMCSMVEEQMRSSIIAVGSLIYTAWVNAGQPVLDFEEDFELVPELIIPDKNVKTRAHE